MENHLVTPADHDAGFKTLEVLRRNGKREEVTLRAPSYRHAQRIMMELQQSKDANCVVKATLADPMFLHASPEEFLNCLTVESAAVVENTAFALTFGSEFQKKMAAIGEKLVNQMAATDSAPKFTLPVEGLTSATSVPIHCPSCHCTIELLGESPSRMKSGKSPSAPQAA